ncbi:hypothetical protein [Sporosalibacterium faouarense]|uniref:hypothetical protein n=1 Tax=Sporosalibacterium faouarense TaxID=516123 RepID=UPI00141CEBE6|nr:hypothetical protein [Sporosalibacterium faouarense]MTI48107.1 hypothetical protein [Bacillota bacterium]
MLVCPKCKNEYREGFKICSDCNVNLVEKEEVSEQKDNYMETEQEMELVFLKNISDGFESDTVISLLESNDIIVFEKQKGSGQLLKIYGARNCQGTDLYVPKHQIEKAEEVIEFLEHNSSDSDYFEEKSSEEEGLIESVDTKEFEENEDISKNKSFRWVILLFCIIPVLILVLIYMRQIF